jgi:hypothetical protein
VDDRAAAAAAERGDGVDRWGLGLGRRLASRLGSGKGWERIRVGGGGRPAGVFIRPLADRAATGPSPSTGRAATVPRAEAAAHGTVRPSGRAARSPYTPDRAVPSTGPF